MSRTRLLVAAMAVLLAAVVVQGAPTWQVLSNSTGSGSLGGSDLEGGDFVSDGTTLYRVGGVGVSNAYSIFQYDPNGNSWTTLTSANPNGYAHWKDNWELSRANYYYDPIAGVGKIFAYASAGQSLNIYTLGGGWTANPFPFPEGYGPAWGQNRAFNSVTGMFYAQLAGTNGSTYSNFSAPFDIKGGTGWGAVSPTMNTAIGGNLEFEDNGSKVFAFSQYGPTVQLKYYDLLKPGQPQDFTGTWDTTSTYDLGMALGTQYGADMMAYDADTDKLYVVGVNTGITLEYDVAHDGWKRLADLPEGYSSYRYQTVEVADGWLYFLDNNQGLGLGYGEFARLEVPEPATLTLLALGSLAVIRRRIRC